MSTAERCGHGCVRCYRGNTVSYLDATSVRRRRAVVAAMIVVWVVIVGADSTLVGRQSAPDMHGPHALIAHTADAPVLVAIEHPHVSRSDTPLTPDTFAEAVLPRGAVSLLVVAFMAFLVGGSLLWRHRGGIGLAGPAPSEITHAVRARRSRSVLHRALLIG